jgi:hypothetical protein
MLLKIGIGIVVLLAVFLGYVSSRDGKFHYERSGVIQAPKSKIYAYISHLKMGEQWSPYEKLDPNMKKTFVGQDGQVGSTMEFDGNKDVGAGMLEILQQTENEAVQLKLTMLKPFHGENIIDYKLTEEAGGTRFSWAMRGDGGFMGKLIGVLIDCEKMVGDQFSQGIQNLKTVVETQK